MKFLDFYNNVRIFFKLNFYKLIYGKKLKVGKNFYFRKGFFIVIENDAKLTIGDGCFFNNYCSINVLKNIEIGDNCIFGEGVRFYDHNHVFNKKGLNIKNQGYKSQDIKVGNNCWFGSNSIILKGVTIGNNVVIGAGCIVKENIPDNTIVKPSSKLELEELVLKD